jgi:hypothetical protein
MMYFFWANRIGVIALAVGVACACAIAISGKIRDDRLKLELAESANKTADAELKLAQLRKLSGPRDVDFDAFKKEIEGKPKAPVVIWYLPDSSDGYWFASRLFTALGIAKWDVAFPTPIPDLDEKSVEAPMPGATKLLSILRGMPRAVNAGGQPSGVTVVGANEQLDSTQETPLRALLNALSKSTNFGMYGSGGSQFMPVPPGTLRVVIAAKTDPLFRDTPAPTAPK